MEVYTYGSGECDQLGLGDEGVLESRIPRKLNIFNTSIHTKVYKIVCGGLHTLVLTTYGQIYSWGCNDDGALGRPGSENTPLLVDGIKIPVNELSAGDSHSIAVNTELNRVFIWGAYRTGDGKIGEPKMLPEEMDIKLFGGNKISKVASGANHTLVLAEGRVYVWGNPESCRLGRKPVPRRFNRCLTPDRLGSKYVHDIYCGASHSFLITKIKNKKTIKAWGLNNYGQLGTGDTEDRWLPTEIEFFKDKHVIMASGGDYHSVVLTDNGEVFVWGKNDEGQLGIPNDPHSKYQLFLSPQKLGFFTEIDNKVKFITSSMGFNYAMTDSNQIYSWGDGQQYVLGNKQEDSEFTPYEIKKEFFFRKYVNQIGLGGQHVVVALSEEEAVHPQFEYNLADYVEKIEKKVKGRKSAAGKRRESSESQTNTDSNPTKKNKKVTYRKTTEIIIEEVIQNYPDES